MSVETFVIESSGEIAALTIGAGSKVRVGSMVVVPLGRGYFIQSSDDAESLAFQLLRAERTAKKKRIRKVRS